MKGFKKKVMEFSNLGSVSITFFFIFKHGLNHPEMQRKGGEQVLGA